MTARPFVVVFWLGTVLWALIFYVAVAGLTSAFAQTTMVMTLGSRHLDGGSYCETNLGLGLEQGDTTRRIVGFYKNSLCRTSVYLGWTWQPLQSANWRLGVVGMGVTGYEDPVTLGAGLALTYAGLGNVIWFPNKKGNFGNGVIGLQAVRRFE